MFGFTWQLTLCLGHRLPAAVLDSLGSAGEELKNKIRTFSEKYNMKALDSARTGHASSPTASGSSVPVAPRTLARPAFTPGDSPKDVTRTLSGTTCSKEELDAKEFLAIRILTLLFQIGVLPAFMFMTHEKPLRLWAQATAIGQNHIKVVICKDFSMYLLNVSMSLIRRRFT